MFVASASMVLLADLITKLAVVQRLAPGESAGIIGDYLKLSHVRNTGASFGLFPGNAYTLIAISSLAALVVIYLAVRSRGRWAAMVYLGLILGGALGNLHDRIRLREVVDFIDIGIGAYRWPVFNVADIAVTIGVFLMLIEYLRSDGKERRLAGGREDERGEGAEGEGGTGS